MKFPGLIATVAFSVCGFVVFGWNPALSAQQTRPTNIHVSSRRSRFLTCERW